VGELLYGSATFRPMSSMEALEWAKLWEIRANERKSRK